jgi:hypothetical protein
VIVQPGQALLARSVGLVARDHAGQLQQPAVSLPAPASWTDASPQNPHKSGARGVGAHKKPTDKTEKRKVGSSTLPLITGTITGLALWPAHMAGREPFSCDL